MPRWRMKDYLNKLLAHTRGAEIHVKYTL